jgi:hypothetical protein
VEPRGEAARVEYSVETGPFRLEGTAVVDIR